MNIQHACQCYAPAPQPGPQQQPAQQPGSEPAAASTSVQQTPTLVASFSYSYAAYVSQAYVSAASQSAAHGDAAEQAGGTTATAASQPKTFDLAALQFGVSFVASYAAVRQESVPAGGKPSMDGPTGPSNPAGEAPAETPAPQPAKVLTGTVRAALRPETTGSSDTAAPATAGGSPAPVTAEPAARPGKTDEPAIERAGPAEFRKFRLKQFQASTETSLKLELQTREGDRIVLDFSQIESLSRTGFRGRDDDGGRMRFMETARSLERLVNIEISGDISEEERAAIEAVFDRVLEVANSFFGGSAEAALSKVRDLEIDTDALLDFSLQMTRKRSIEATRVYRNADPGLERLASRDVEVGRTLESLGASQRGLVAEAREVLDDRSAAKLVRSLLPALLEKSKLDPAEVIAKADAQPAAAQPQPAEQPAAA